MIDALILFLKLLAVGVPVIIAGATVVSMVRAHRRHRRSRARLARIVAENEKRLARQGLRSGPDGRVIAIHEKDTT